MSVSRIFCWTRGAGDYGCRNEPRRGELLGQRLGSRRSHVSVYKPAEGVSVISPAGNSIPTAWSGTLLHGSLGRDTVVWTSSRRWLRLTVTVSCISELSRARWLLGYNDGGADGKHP